MSDVLRILDRFRITGRGIVYTVKISKGAVIHLGDIFSDLKGNRFEVSGIEMSRVMIPEGKSFEEMPLGLMFKQLDGVEVSGNILVSKEFYKSFENDERIPTEEVFLEGTVILAGDPMPDKTAEQMRLDIAGISNTQELVDAYVQVHNKFWYINTFPICRTIDCRQTGLHPFWVDLEAV